ncbi:MAG: SAM-dependent methyltransferase [Syntrophomonadaceae bacterium]|nr:SAM-dependent methyltransferase [Syntrophomonadaceae bacterium]
MCALTPRLAAIAALLTPGQTAADIGADHAQLSIYLALKNVAPRVIIGELGTGPLERALRAVAAYGLQSRIEVRQGDGLRVLAPGEVANVILAGLGGDTLARMLAADWEKAASFPNYVFQPMSKPEVLRQALADRGWQIVSETVVEERGRLYLVLTSHPGMQPYQLSDIEIAVGPRILQAETEIKRQYIWRILQAWLRIESRLRSSTQAENRRQAEIIRERIQRLEEIWHANQGK